MGLLVLVAPEQVLSRPPPYLDDSGPQSLSPNQKFAAEPADGEKTTVVYRMTGTPHKPEYWRMPGWERNTFLADDGLHLIRGYSGFEVLSHRDAKPSTVMLQFFKHRQLVRSVTLSEVLRDLKKLPRTAYGSYYWGTYVGFLGPARFAIDTAEDRRIVYAVTTGLVVENIPRPLSPHEKARLEEKAKERGHRPAVRHRRREVR